MDRGLKSIPADLLGAAIMALAALLFTLTPLSALFLRVPIGLLMVLFVPGYVLIAALFPKREDLDGIERIALSFGLSIAVVPLIGLGLNYTPWGSGCSRLSYPSPPSPCSWPPLPTGGACPSPQRRGSPFISASGLIH